MAFIATVSEACYIICSVSSNIWQPIFLSYQSMIFLILVSANRF